MSDDLQARYDRLVDAAREVADRGRLGAIGRDANGKAVEVVDGGAAGVWFTSGYGAGQLPSAIEAERWPMRVVWLPEDGDQ